MSRQLTKNFRVSEFSCHCGCGKDNINIVIVKILQGYRDYRGSPITPRSGVRCEARNQREGGKETSAHLSGLAIDIPCTWCQERFDMIAYFKRWDITRFGIGKTFLHIDIDESKAQNVMWVY